MPLPLVFYLESAQSGAHSRTPRPQDHRSAHSQRGGRSPRPGTLRPGECPRQGHAPESDPRTAPSPPRPPLFLIGNILLFLSPLPPPLPAPAWISSARRPGVAGAEPTAGRAVSGGGRPATRAEAGGGGRAASGPAMPGPRRRILRWSRTFRGSRRASVCRGDASSLGWGPGPLGINACGSGSWTKAVCWGARWAGEKGALGGWLRSRPPCPPPASPAGRRAGRGSPRHPPASVRGLAPLVGSACVSQASPRCSSLGL